MGKHAKAAMASAPWLCLTAPWGFSVLQFAIAACAILLLPTHGAAQGWWWGSPIDPGFDPKRIVEVTGTANRVAIIPWGKPSTLELNTVSQNWSVIIGPGWYLTELQADIRIGDTLSIKGSKMTDRRGQVYLVASRVTNQRTGAVLELRDESGRPRWKRHGGAGG